MAAKVPARWVLISLVVWFGLLRYVPLTFFPKAWTDFFYVVSFTQKERLEIFSFYFINGIGLMQIGGAWSGAVRLVGAEGKSWIMLFSGLFVVLFTARKMYFTFGPSWAEDLAHTDEWKDILDWVISFILALCCFAATDFSQLHKNISKAPLYWGYFLLVVYALIHALWCDIDLEGLSKSNGYSIADFTSHSALAIYKYTLYAGYASICWGLVLTSLAVIFAGDHRWTLAVSRWFAVCNALVVGYNIAMAPHASDLGMTESATACTWGNLICVIFFFLFYLPVMFADVHPEMNTLAARNTEGWDSVSSEE